MMQGQEEREEGHHERTCLSSFTPPAPTASWHRLSESCGAQPTGEGVGNMWGKCEKGLEWVPGRSGLKAGTGRQRAERHSLQVRVWETCGGKMWGENAGKV